MNTKETNDTELSSLVSDVELLCLDAGNTLVFLAHDVVAEVARREGYALEVPALVEAEGAAKRRLSPGVMKNTGDKTLLEAPLDDADIPAGWSAFVGTMVSLAGLRERTALERCVRALWREHYGFNLWRRVPEGLADALRGLRARGVPVCVVSNSEGMLDALFARVGLEGCFDHVIDSALVGVEKPDPAIFALALERFDVAPARALHLGDTVATDVDGARRAGVRAALLDPFAHYEGLYQDVPRVPSVARVAEALAAARTQQRA